jgi:hypothetical protein
VQRDLVKADKVLEVLRKYKQIAEERAKEEFM